MQLLYSIDDVIAATGIGRTKLYQIISSGELSAKKHGKRTYVLREDLDTFIANLEPYNLGEGQ